MHHQMPNSESRHVAMWGDEVNTCLSLKGSLDPEIVLLIGT